MGKIEGKIKIRCFRTEKMFHTATDRNAYKELVCSLLLDDSKIENGHDTEEQEV